MFLKRWEELSTCVDGCECTTQKGIVESDEALNMAHFLLRQVKNNNGIAYIIGNGGSAGIASHFCTDLMRTQSIGASTLTDSNVITCFANDIGYEFIFSKSLDCLLRPDDILVAVSSSGKSPNILAGVKVAKQKKNPVITFSGFAPTNPLRSMGDVNFYLPKSDYGIVEAGHFFLLHTVIDTYPARDYATKN